jgi:hypothetical protein
VVSELWLHRGGYLYIYIYMIEPFSLGVDYGCYNHKELLYSQQGSRFSIDFVRFAVFCGEIVFFPEEVKLLFTQFVVNSSFRA